MKLEIFKAEDFQWFNCCNWMDRTEMANQANAKLNKWLAENSVRVLCHKLGESNLTDEHGPGWTAAEESTRITKGSTHSALLIGIEPIEQECKHPKEKVHHKTHLSSTSSLAFPGWECECGAKVRPSSFVKVEDSP